MYTRDSHHGERSLTCCFASRSVARADLRRSLIGLARMSRNSAAHNSRVLAFQQYAVCASPFCSQPTFLPSFAPRPLWRFLAPMKALTPGCLSHAQRGIPDSQHLNCSVVLAPTTPCPSMYASSTLICFAFWTFPRRTVSRPRPPGLRASPFTSRLAKIMRPNRVSLVRTDRLAFRCSPPRLSRRRSYGQLSTS